MKFFFLSLVAFFYATTSVAVNSDSMLKSQSKTIAFTENKGQVHDQHYKARPDVLFSGTDGKLVFHLKNNGISYQLNRVDSWKEEEDHKTKDDALSVSKGKRQVVDKSTIYRVDINWLNANPQAAVRTGNALEGYNNYYLESCPNGALNVKSYETVEYQNIYNGINLKWYQNKGQLKYDYVVAPHANYKQIQLEIKGAQLQLQKNGCLLLKTPLGTIEEHAPLVYQNGKQLKANYVLKGNVLSFNVENYDPAQELIIDPVVRLWGTYYGGNGGAGNDFGNSCIVDNLNNVYLAGSTEHNSGTIIATVGSHQSTFGGATDAFLVKFNSSGSRQWGTYYGGSGDDRAFACTIDASGNVFIAGRTNSSGVGIISTAGSHQTTIGGGDDAFLVKFNTSGIRLWGTYYGGTGNDEGRSCSTDASGNVYLAGHTLSNISTVIATTGAHQSTIGGSLDAFLVKFNASGVRQWGTYYGGTASDRGNCCITDASGNVFLGGETSSNSGTEIATGLSHQASFGGGIFNDAFLVKFNSNGVRQWGTYYGGNAFDAGYSCATDATGNVYFAGRTNSNTGTVIATPGAHQSALGGSSNAFLVKFNSGGVRQWGTYYGGNGEIGNSCLTDANGNIYLAGRTDCLTSSIVATPGSHQINFGGNSEDAFLVKFNSSGIRQWGTYYGGNGDESAFSCSADNSGNIYLAGSSSSTTGTVIATPSSHQPNHGGPQYDAFLVKFKDCPTIGASVNANTPLCQNSTLNFTTTVTSTLTLNYNWQGPNSFTANVQNPSIANTPTANAGTYTLTVNDGQGCSETATVSVSVNLKPTVAVNSGSICSSNSFTINPSGASTYTIQGGNAVVSPNTNTSYTVIGTSTAGCVSDVATSNVTVFATPTIAVNSGSICSGNSFTLNPSGASTYTIQGGNVVVSPTVNASYTVVGTSTAGCISNTFATANVTVNALPTITVNSGAICSGNSFTINPSGANTYTIQGGNAVVSPTTNASYTVAGTSTAGCVSVLFATSNVTVNANPTITAISNQTLCLGNTFTLTPSGGTSYTVTQGLSLPASFTNSIVITPTAGLSIYTVTGTNSLSCSGSNTLSTLVNPNPNVTAVTSATSFICVGQSATLSATGAQTYTWSPAIPMSGVISPSTTTSYTVVGQDVNGCQNTAVVTQSVDACTGIGKNQIDNTNINIYPNPSTGIYNLQTNTDIEITLTDVLGKIVLTKKINAGTYQLNLTEQANGTYFIKAISNGQVKSKRLIKQ